MYRSRVHRNIRYIRITITALSVARARPRITMMRSGVRVKYLAETTLPTPPANRRHNNNQHIYTSQRTSINTLRAAHNTRNQSLWWFIVRTRKSPHVRRQCVGKHARALARGAGRKRAMYCRMCLAARSKTTPTCALPPRARFICAIVEHICAPPPHTYVTVHNILASVRSARTLVRVCVHFS